MSNDQEQLNKLLDRYDDLAVDVVGDLESNAPRGLPYTNVEMTEIILEILNWESFDLFHAIDFEAAFNVTDSDHVRAYCFLAYLRYDLFIVAIAAGVGDESFNKTAAATSEYWFRRLKDRINTLSVGDTGATKHNWIH